ncbi:MAG: transporter substrate-binding domain-containing protein [Quinella sp. 1Q7]|nr:transporter substrate-binding domain-containing protein [Quinella sp. 1Q7]
MKKFFVTICAAALLMTGCGGSEQAAVDKPAAEPKSIKLGMITPLNSDEQKMEGVLTSVLESFGVKDTRHLPKFYDNLKTMQMGIDSGNVEQISLYKCVANYLIASNDKYELVPNNALEKIGYSFCFGVRKDEVNLKADLDKAIDAMKSDGTLDKLVAEYITNVKPDNIPTVEIPHVDGAETIKVGVTGDLPPLDLILPDGSPAGFNTAMLAEVSKRINRNVELVQIESGARAAALNSKLIDVVFWTIVPLSDKIPADLDKPEGMELSKPYFQDSVAHIKLKSSK